MKSDKLKKFSLAIVLFITASCSHIKIDTPRNEVIDAVNYKNQKYLIPIPKNYCRYNPKVKSDQPVLNFISEEGQKEIISLYEESCEAKEKVISGDLRDSPRSIEVDLNEQKNDNIEYITRKDLIDFYYDNTSVKIDKVANKKTLTKMYNDLTEERLLKYGFSRKRSEILREDYKGYAENNNGKAKKDKDEYAFYLLNSGGSNKTRSYSIEAHTKLYNKNILVIITRTTENVDYDRSIANSLIEEAKSYMREFVTLNDQNDYRAYSINDKKIKIFTPQGFLFPSKEEKDFVAKFNETRFLGPKDKNFKEAFIKSKSDEFRRLAIGLPLGAENLNPKYLESKATYIDATYITIRKTFSIRSFNVTKERNSVFFMICDDDNMCDDDSKKHNVIFLASTLIKNVPVIIMGEIFSKGAGDKALKKDSILAFKEEILNYIDLIDGNQ